MHARHHLHLRKRLEPYPASTPWKRLLDRTVLFVGIVGPLVTIPQIAKIYLYHDASDLALISWATYALFDIPWIAYGIAHREIPIIITYTLWLVVNTTVTVGIILWGTGLW